MKYFNPQDHYFREAKKHGYKARSAFKLEEIDQKYRIFDAKVKTVLDIGCAPGSRLQYTRSKIKDQRAKIIGLDVKAVELNLEGVDTYVQDIQDQEGVQKILDDHGIKEFDAIISDMAPNTLGFKDVDAMRSIVLLEKTLRLYERYLKKPDGKIVIKIFMGPGFEEFVKKIKEIAGGKNVKVYKPKACRRDSKETYIVKY